jgi:hypothetical protein
MAGVELSVLGRQCFDRRIPDIDALRLEVAARRGRGTRPP